MRPDHRPTAFHFKKAARELLDWFSPARYLNEDTFTVRLHTYKITAFVVFFLYSFFNFLTGLFFSFLVTAVCSMVVILVGYLIDVGKTRAAYILLLSTFNFSLLLISYLEGIDSGAYIFFFPCITSFSFLADLTDKRVTLFTYATCLISFLVCFFVLPHLPSIQEMSESVADFNFKSTIVNAFLLLIWMSFSLAKENYRRQSVLKEKETFLNAIFNTSLYAELIVDTATGAITEHNSYAAELFGVTNGRLTGKSACDLFYELTQDGAEDLYREMCSAVKNWEGELTCIRADGSRFPASTHIATFKYNGKDYKKMSIADITDRKIMLNQLRDAKIKAEESALVKTQFLSNMSHELRTPLNGIIGATNLLLQEKHLPSQNEQLNILKFSSEHMLSLINDILDLSKLEANKMKLEHIAVDIHKFTNTLASVFIQQFDEKGLTFEVIVDPVLNKRPVLTDPTRLNQVLTNLLSNALKFTSSGGVKLEVKALSATSESMNIEFNVTDTGIGISEEQRKKIFGQFIQADTKTTRKYGGTGLGLTISQRLVQLLGGELKVESKYHKGSRFYFDIVLPVSRGRDKVYVDNKTPADSAQLKNLKVLIAEDNPVNMMIVSRFLDKWGVKYQKAGNGLEAVSLFSQNEFDVILMDLEMPEMDGYSALLEIRKTNTRVPAIAFTAAVFENMREKLTESGFEDYIQKPFQPEDLRGRLAKYTNGISKTP